MSLLTAALLGLQTVAPSLPTREPSVDLLAGLARVDWDGWEELGDLLEDVRACTGVPALAAAWVCDGGVVASDARGVAAADDDTPIDRAAAFHLGSLTKAFTAVVVARLVERGELRFETTVGDLLGSVEMHAAYRDVTVQDLLRHRGGIPSYTSERPDGASDSAFDVGTPTERRADFLADALRIAPAVPRGTMLYSNAGFALAGHMAEVAAGASWEELVRELVLEPLGMKDTDVGLPGTPLGHVLRDGRCVPVPLDAYPSLAHIAPAGDLHSTIDDLTTWARFQLDGLAGEDGVLSAATVARLIGVGEEGLDYAGGWFVRGSSGDDREYRHGGSVGASYAEMRLWPDERAAGIVLVTVPPGIGEVLANRFLRALQQRFAPSKGKGDMPAFSSRGETVTEAPTADSEDAACWSVVERLARALNAEDRAAFHALCSGAQDRADLESMFDFMARSVFPSRGPIRSFHALGPPLSIGNEERTTRVITFHLELGLPGYFALKLDGSERIEELSIFVKADLCPSGPDPLCPEIARHLGEPEREDERAFAEEAQAALVRAAEAEHSADFWEAATELARLCRTGSPVPARALRERALELLAERPTQSRRWAALVGEQFMPPIDRLDSDRIAAELDAYDRTLADLAAEASDDAVRAELLHARVFAVVVAERRGAIPSAWRERSLALLDELEGPLGARPTPGAADPASDTVAARAARLRYELTSLGLGAPAPDTNGVDLDGKPFDLASLRGQVVVLDFWTSFCEPCLALVPGARRMLERLEGAPVAYVGVCGDDDRGRGAATVRRVGMPWRSLWDGPLGTSGPAATAWCVEATGWPSLFVLDREGRIRARIHGGEDVERRIEAVVRRLLAESPR